MKRSLHYEMVLEKIKVKLTFGSLRPGDRLPTIAEMAAQTGVNQASVREAYRVLESMGILEVTQGRGTFVSPNFAGQKDILHGFQWAETQSLSHLFETRRILEPSIAGLAAERAMVAEVDAIESTAREMEDLHARGEDFLDPDVRFHELIVKSTHNPVMTKMLAAVNELLLDSRRRTMRITGAAEKAVHYHLLIALAIRDRNPDSARSLMLQHVSDVERDAMRSDGRSGQGSRPGGSRRASRARHGDDEGGT